MPLANGHKKIKEIARCWFFGRMETPGNVKFSDKKGA
jgi:hypothetical protein